MTRWLLRFALWRCRVLGMHLYPYNVNRFDGVNMHVTCSRCGKAGIIDSQGNLF